MIIISSNNVYVLFDPSAIHFFISTSFFKSNSGLSPVFLGIDLYISISSGDIILINSICKDCILCIKDKEMKVNLLVLELYFDLILGMDWLAT